MYTFFTGSSENPKYATDVSRIGFQVGYDITPNLTAYWNRTPNDALWEEVNHAANTPSIDLIDEIGLSYRLARNWSAAAGSFRWWRQCCPGAGDPTNKNPTAERGFSVTTTYTFGPDTIIGKPFLASVQGVAWDHHLNAAAVAGAKALGIQPHGNTPTIAETLAYRIPVFHQRRFVPFINVQELSTYFDSSAEPTYSNAINYGASIVGSRLVTYTFTVRNYTGRQEGYPFAYPNTSHYSRLIAQANFHGRL